MKRIGGIGSLDHEGVGPRRHIGVGSYTAVSVVVPVFVVAFQPIVVDDSVVAEGN